MSNHKFSKVNRLLKRKDFNYLRVGSKKYADNKLILFTKKIDQKSTKLGISVSKRVGKANIRNFCKRIVREFFRTSSYKNLNLSILVVVNPKFFSKLDDRDDIRDNLLKSLDALFKKLAKV